MGDLRWRMGDGVGEKAGLIGYAHAEPHGRPLCGHPWALGRVCGGGIIGWARAGTLGMPLFGRSVGLGRVTGSGLLVEQAGDGGIFGLGEVQGAVGIGGVAEGGALGA